MRDKLSKKYYKYFERKAKIDILNNDSESSYALAYLFLKDFKDNFALSKVPNDYPYGYSSQKDFDIIFKDVKYATLSVNKYNKVFTYNIKYDLFSEYIKDEVINGLSEKNNESYQHCLWFFIYYFLATKITLKYNQEEICFVQI